MTKFSLNRCCIALLISAIFTLTLANTTKAAPGSSAAHARQDATSQYVVRLPTVCDTSKANYGYKCSVSEIETVLQPLQVQLADIQAKYASLVASNVELFCEPDLKNWGFWSTDYEAADFLNSSSMFGPCVGGYKEFNSRMYLLFFPCSNPNVRFEQVFPSDYWVGYYDSVNRSQNYPGGCNRGFASDVGISYKFLKVWEDKWAPIFPTYKTLITEYLRLSEQIDEVDNNLETARSIPPHKPGDCQWNKSDPTYGFLAKGKTVVDDYGYKFTCGSSGIRRTGRVPLKAASLSCPEYDSPTGNTCWVRTTWGTSSQLTRLPKYSPNGKVVDTGWFISLTGYQCTVKLYANFAYRETCK